MRLDRTLHPPNKNVPGLVLILARPEDHDIVNEIERRHEWFRGKLRERLKGGDLCMVAYLDDRMVGFNLVSVGSVAIPLIHQVRVLRAMEAWSSHIAVWKPYRERKIASQLRHATFEVLRQRNIRKFYGGTLASNEPSMRLARHVGFTRFVDVHYLKILHLKWWRYARVRNPKGSNGKQEAV